CAVASSSPYWSLVRFAFLLSQTLLRSVGRMWASFKHLKESQFYPKFPCHSRIETAVATVRLVIGVDGHIQEAQVVKVEVTPPDMESCAVDLAHAEALLLRYSKPAQVCGTTIRLRFTSGGP